MPLADPDGASTVQVPFRSACGSVCGRVSSAGLSSPGRERGEEQQLDHPSGIVLGIVQGICEFVPISSSGHLIIVPWLFNWDFFLAHPELNKTFDVALHLGTFVAVVAYYWRDIGHILRDFFRSLMRRRIESPGERLAWLLLLSTIPAGVLGVAFEKWSRTSSASPG